MAPLVVLLLGSLSAFAAVPPLSQTLPPAVQALDHCIFPQAPIWAERIERQDPTLAAVFRLAWLQKQGGPQPAQTTSVSDSLVEWPFETEIWRDEWKENLRHWSCTTTEKSVLLSEVPAEVLQSQMRILLKRFGGLSPSEKRLVEDFAAFEKLQGKETLPNVEGATDCEREIFSEDPVLAGFVVRCPGRRGILWAMAYSRSADSALSQSHFSAAAKGYSAAIEALEGKAVPSTLWYRLAVAQVASGAKDDAIFRSAQQAGRDDSVAPVYRAALSQLLCDRVAEIDSGKLQALFRKIYSNQAAAELQTVAEDCGGARASTLIHALLKAGARDRASITLRALLLESSDWPKDVEPSVRALARFSRTYPSQTSMAFWKGIEKSPFSSQALALYRRLANWQAADQSRSKRRTEKTSGDLVVDAFQGKPQRLPLAFQLPQMNWDSEIPVDFLAVFEKASAEKGL